MKTKKFTMVELLVVVAIIAILMMMILPALDSARKKARSITCLGNLKQLGSAVIMYVGDNNDFFPVGDKDKYNHDKAALNQLARYCSAKNKSGTETFDSGWSVDYYPTNKVVVCPEAAGTGTGGAIRYYDSYTISQLTRSKFTDVDYLWSMIGRFPKISKLPKYRIFLIPDGGIDVNTYWNQPTDSNYQIRYRHGSANGIYGPLHKGSFFNVVWSDGSATSFTKNTYPGYGKIFD